MDVQRNFESNVEKRTKDAYGPPPGKKLVVFIDDLNMPKVDTYGTQQPIALLKLLLEKGGMYDRGKDLNWKKYQDMIFIAAMGKVCCYFYSFFFSLLKFFIAWRWKK
jgi:dynein heavy chain